MKRIASALLTALLILSCSLFAVSCKDDGGEQSGSESESAEPQSGFDSIDFTTEQFDIALAAEKSVAAITFDDELYPVNDAVVANNYGIKDMYKALSAYCSSMATAECVTIVYCESSDIAAEVADKFTAYAERMAKVYESYNVTESEKLKKAYVDSFGNYAVFCVAKDPVAAEKAIKDAIVSLVP